MDLKTFKNIEHFCNIIGLTNINITDKMEIELKDNHLYLELNQNQVIFTVGQKLEHPRGIQSYQYLLKQTPLEKYKGFPVLCMYIDSLLTCTLKIPESHIQSSFLVEIYRIVVQDLEKSIRYGLKTHL